ncbi:MAG: hypothetical protein V4611_03225 [Patescibacteria group bacterium]
MELREPFRPKKKHVSPEMLVGACRKFANVLANNQWRDIESRNVCITRSYTQGIGMNFTRTRDLPLDYQYDLENVFMRVTVEFEGDKETLTEDEKGIALMETFVATTTMVRSVQPEEIPVAIRERMIKRLESTVAEDIEAEMSVEDILRKFILEEKQTVCYVINDKGEIDDYTTSIAYLANGKKIIGKKYNHFQSIDESAGIQTGWDDDGALESHEYVDGDMDDSDVTRLIEDFDLVLKEINDQVNMERLLESAMPPEDESRRRALAMIGLAASGMSGLGSLAAKLPIRERLYDFLSFLKL